MRFEAKPLELKVKFPKLPKAKRPNNKFYKRRMRELKRGLPRV